MSQAVSANKEKELYKKLFLIDIVINREIRLFRDRRYAVWKNNSDMNEEIDLILETTKEAMQDSVAHLEKSLLNIRAGKASPQMLGSIFVDYYGSQTPLAQVANVNTPDSRTISIQPWEKNMLSVIEKAIMVANRGA